ncbi:MAG: carbohydrate-binding protein [Planctomycetota bacterium]|nr:carbohydrate-binding protein [Planctomycetota bacterium]
MVARSLLGVAVVTAPAAAQEKLHFTYMWHLEQPIYWPDGAPGAASPTRYERAWETILRQDAGGTRPGDNLRAIFGTADRVAAYQYRVKDSISAFSTAPEAGAQVSYSGGLIENIWSLGDANQLGYSGSWTANWRAARGWMTSTPANNKPRLDMVLFSFHHALLPLLDDAAVRKEIQLYKRAYVDAWGSVSPMSRGLFPSEMAFSTRLIPVLASEGIAWSFVSSEKISRACEDFPVVLGSGGVNCDPPNRADQVNPPGGTFYRQSISRGCGPAEAVPLAYTPNYAQHVDPNTGSISRILVVPCSQSLGWKDGYNPLGLGDFNAIDALARPSRPMLMVLAHDGDNAWGGGYSYYMEATPQLVSSARNAGYVPTVVEKYLADHPVPTGSIVHVEDGAWVNADGCFGSPQFLNWNWPPLNASGQIDVENGWHVDIRNWAVITANQNRINTAEQMTRDAGGAVRIDKILYPDSASNGVERAWHFFLGGLNSGFMYYGTALDMEDKPSISGNRAMQFVEPVIAAGGVNAVGGAGNQPDRTPPTIWAVQREPWNPGASNFGPSHGYRQVQNNGDFHVWSFVSDVSGIGAGGASVTLKYRLDADGVNPIDSIYNETYAGGGGEVGAWQSIAMTRRPFPAGNVYNDPTISFVEMPRFIADQYHARITGVRSALVDYYIEAVDIRGNFARSPIHHVYVGAGTTGGGGGPTVSLSPAVPVAGQNVTIVYDSANRPLAGATSVRLHYGFNEWSQVATPDPTMAPVPGQAGAWVVTVPVSPNATQLCLAFNNGAGAWDNNGGADWKFSVQGGVPVENWVMDGVRDPSALRVAGNPNGIDLWAGMRMVGGAEMLYIATQDAGEGNDHFILLARDQEPHALRGAMWAKAGQVAQWEAFLADENGNDYEGWSDQGPSSQAQAATGPNGGVLEGMINLRAELGIPAGDPLPETIRLAVALFGTADGGQLLRTHQVQPSVNNDFNVDASEHVVVRLCDIAVGAGLAPCCSADFNRDGTPDFFDYLDFVLAFANEEPAADFNSDGVVDFFDYLDFAAAFDAGCN